MKYRADIDGLRAAAVLPVVFYHLGFRLTPGGFVGVDIFFVISGYLITTLILEELAAGRFTLTGFYQRRIRRIFPALYVVLAACALAASLILMPEDFDRFGRSAMATAFFVSNVFFARAAGYFSPPAEFEPLLHTWSLAVEEQFYLIFPLILLVLQRFVPRRTPHILGGLLLVSFALGLWAVWASPINGFYVTPYRFWELLIGAFLALGRIPQAPRALNAALALGGAAMIAAAVLSFDATTPYPGYAALLPCLGAALIIHTGSRGTPVGRLLSLAPLVFIGRISYSLYLWHWPLIAFWKYRSGHDLDSLEAGTILVLSLSAATVSWYFVEQPIRRRLWLARPAECLAAASAAMAFCLAGGLWIVDSGGAPGRLPAAALKIYAAKSDAAANGWSCVIDPMQADSDLVARIRAGRLCAIGQGGGSAVDFLVWGDSHAGAMAPGIGEAARAAGLRGLIVSVGTCPPAPGIRAISHNPGRLERCPQAIGATLDLIAARHITLVFLVARWPKYVLGSEYGKEGPFFDPGKVRPPQDRSAEVGAALDAQLTTLDRLGVHAVLVMDVPEPGYDVPYALARAALRGEAVDIAPSRAIVRARQTLALAMLSELALRHGADLVDPTSSLCDATRCAVERNGIPLYKDADHLTQSAARALGGIFTGAFEHWQAERKLASRANDLQDAGSRRTIEASSPPSDIAPDAAIERPRRPTSLGL